MTYISNRFRKLFLPRGVRIIINGFKKLDIETDFSYYYDYNYVMVHSKKTENFIFDLSIGENNTTELKITKNLKIDSLKYLNYLFKKYGSVDGFGYNPYRSGLCCYYLENENYKKIANDLTSEEYKQYLDISNYNL